MYNRILLTYVVFLFLLTSACIGQNQPLEPIEVKAQSFERYNLCEGSDVAFISGQLAKTLLEQNDAYIQSLSQLDCKCLCGSNSDAGKKKYINQLQSEVLNWSERERNRIKASCDLFRNSMNQLKLNLPKTIYLIKVYDGAYQSLAFTRLSFIVFTRAMLRSDMLVDHVFPHEVGHVHSRYNPKLAEKLYNLIEFHCEGPLKLTEDLQDKRLSNPDYTEDTFNIEVTVNHGALKGETVTVFPIVTGNDKNIEEGWEDFYTLYGEGFKLLVAERKDWYFVPKIINGRPVMLDAYDTNIEEIIKNNTDYIHGPEEVMAENFYILLHFLKNERFRAKHKDILEKMKSTILKHNTSSE